MKVNLAQIVLYSHDGNMRHLKFNTDGLSIITGASKTGKSALIHMIDYCLGSGECHVPEGIIRRKVAWYSILLFSEKEQLFIARKNPESGRSSNARINVVLGKDLQVPAASQLIQNADPDGLKAILNRFLGIEENLHIPSEEQSRDPLAANITHSRIYCFQDQGLIDNKNQLFFNQSDSFVELAIRDTLPYFLGAVTGSELIKQQELHRLRRDQRILEKKIDLEVNWVDLTDDDRTAVKRLFKFIYEKSNADGFQAIVIDHADEPEEWFQKCVIEKWRDGKKLVPDEWPDEIT